MKYSDFGLDDVKKSNYDGDVGRSYCLWCSRKVDGGISLCFSNFVLCRACAFTATLVENNSRWHLIDSFGCWKCKATDIPGLQTDNSQYFICKPCIDMSKRVLTARDKHKEIKIHTTKDMNYDQIMQQLDLLHSSADKEIAIIQGMIDAIGLPKQPDIKPSNKNIIMNVQQAFEQSTVIGNVIKLPTTQLDQKVYAQVKKRYEGIGGKWKGGKVYGFEFPHDPAPLLLDIQSGGKVVNIVKDYQYFPTPAPLADKMAKWFHVEPGMKILEPSAGKGAIVKAILGQYPDIDYIHCCELSPYNLPDLEKIPQALIIGENFLDLDAENFYDRVYANPPFTGNQDIDHVMHMYKVCKPGGKIVTITSTSWVDGSQKKQVEFKDWLKKIGAYIERIPTQTFKESGTLVPAMLVCMTKRL